MHKGPKISAKAFCILLDILSFFFFPSFYFSGVSNLASSPLPLDEAYAGAGGGHLGMDKGRTILTVW